MKGLLIGDVAGSVYRRENIFSEDFPLMETLRRDFYRRSDRTWTESEDRPGLTGASLLALAVDSCLSAGADGLTADRLREAMRQMSVYSSTTYVRYPNGRWYSRTNREADPAVNLPKGLGIWLHEDGAYAGLNVAEGVVAAMGAGALARSAGEAGAVARTVASVTCNDKDMLRQAEVLAGAVWMAGNGSSRREIMDFVSGGLGLDLVKTETEIRRSSAKGELREREDVVLNYQGAQRDSIDRSLSRSIVAGVGAFLNSDSFESAVRKAVSYGGDSPVVAAIAGALAEAAYGVPAELSRRLEDFTDQDMDDILKEYGQSVESFREALVPKERTRAVTGVATLFTEEEVKGDEQLSRTYAEGRALPAQEKEVTAEALAALKAKFTGQEPPQVAVAEEESRSEVFEMPKDTQEERDAFRAEIVRNKAREELLKTPSETVSMLRCAGHPNVWFVPESRTDVRDYLEEKFGDRIIISRPADMPSVLAAMGPSRTGTYLDAPEPEVRQMYFHGGKMTSVTATDSPSVKLPKSVRNEERSAFLKLCDKVQELRTRVQRYAGYDGEGVVHFEHAVNLHIGKDKIDILRGDNLVASVGISPFTGLVRVNVSNQGMERWEVGPFANVGKSLFVEDLPQEKGYKRLSVDEIYQCIEDFCIDSTTYIEAKSNNDRRDQLAGSPYEYEERRPNEEVACDDIANSDDPRLIAYIDNLVGLGRQTAQKKSAVKIPAGARQPGHHGESLKENLFSGQKKSGPSIEIYYGTGDNRDLSNFAERPFEAEVRGPKHTR